MIPTTWINLRLRWAVSYVDWAFTTIGWWKKPSNLAQVAGWRRLNVDAAD